MTGKKHPRTPRPGANPRGVVLGTLAFGFGLPALLFSAVLVLSPISRPAMMTSSSTASRSPCSRSCS
jgi:hypothetical protein